MKQEFLKVGKIVNTYGIKGELKIYLYTDFPEKRFVQGNQLFLGKEGSMINSQVEIEQAKPYKNMYILKIKNIDNINLAEKYKDYYLWIDKKDQGELNEGEYYYHEIIGCKVVTTDGDELGKISDILSPGANDVWIVTPANKGNDILIPYIDSVVKEIDVIEKKVVINLLEGLLDL